MDTQILSKFMSHQVLTAGHSSQLPIGHVIPLSPIMALDTHSITEFSFMSGCHKPCAPSNPVHGRECVVKLYELICSASV